MDLHSGLKIYQPLPLHEHIIYPNWAFWFENLAILFLGPLCLWSSIHSLCSFSFCQFGKRDRLQSEARFQRLIYTASSPSRKKKKKNFEQHVPHFWEQSFTPQRNFFIAGPGRSTLLFLVTGCETQEPGFDHRITTEDQGCQIFLGTTNGHKMYQHYTYIPRPAKIYQNWEI
jgi:hypothetical protein